MGPGLGFQLEPALFIDILSIMDTTRCFPNIYSVWILKCYHSIGIYYSSFEYFIQVQRFCQNSISVATDLSQVEVSIICWVVQVSGVVH